ncbi:MAG: RNA methyltransferase [Vicinamibacterales bacterium]
MAPPVIPAGLEDPRLDDYRHVGDPAWLLARGWFVAEGRLVVERLVADRRHRVHSLLLSEAAARAMVRTVDAVAPDTAVYVTPQKAMNAVVGFNIHRGCLALAERPAAAALDSLPLATASAVVVAEGVNNPDNIGGLFRNAAALGAAGLVLGPDCGDPLYRKAIRTSMAATLRVPWAPAGAWPDALETLRRAGLAIVAATPAPGTVSLYEADLPSRAAVLVGAEGPGLSEAALAKADLRVGIPMHAGMDSLNVATAAAVILAALAARRG